MKRISIFGAPYKIRRFHKGAKQYSRAITKREARRRLYQGKPVNALSSRPILFEIVRKHDHLILPLPLVGATPRNSDALD